MKTTARTPQQKQQTSAALTRSAGVVGSATLLSRVFGYIRDLVLASVLGTGMAADAFFMAFTIPNLMRRLFAEGSLSISFVPVYTYYLDRHGRQAADQLAGSALRVAAATLIAVSATAVLMAPQLVGLLAFGWAAASQKIALCITLTRVMMPYLLFIGLVALFMGILNVLGHFAVPALSPVCLNACMILMLSGAALLSDQAETHVTSLAVGVLVGGVIQFAVHLPVLVRHRFPLRQRFQWWHPGLRRILLLMGPAVFGVAVYQVNTVVVRFLASTLAQGAVSYLYYADRLVQFPLGIFGIATATAVLPALSHQAVTQQWSALRDTFGYALRLVLFITLPSLIGLIVLREPIVRLLFTYGAFDASSMQLTAGVLLYYAMGLWAFAAVRIVLNTFYALQDTRTPVRVGAISVAANMVLGFALMRGMQQNGLALALSLSSILNLVLLLAALHKRLGGLGWRQILHTASRSVLCAVLMGVIVDMLAGRIVPEAGGSMFHLFSATVVCISVGVAVYGCLTFIFRIPELQAVLQIVMRKRSEGR